MVNLTPSQLAVLHGGVKYIKNHVKLKKPRKKSSRNRRKRSRGTRKAQKGGSVKKIIEVLFLSALFGAFLITMGVDAPLNAMIKLISSQVGVNVQAQEILNFIEYLTILLAYNHINWIEAGGMPPNCPAGTNTYGVKGTILSYTTEVLPKWSEECPEKARIMGLYLVSLLAGMLLAFIGSPLLDFIARGVPGLPALAPSPGEDEYAKAEAALEKARKQVAPTSTSKKLLSPQEKKAKKDRRNKRLQTPQVYSGQETTPDGATIIIKPHITGPPVRGDPRIRPSEGVVINPDIRDHLVNAPMAEPKESGDALVVTNQPDKGMFFLPEGTTPQDFIGALRQNGDLDMVANALARAAIKLKDNETFRDFVGTLESGISTNSDGEILAPPVSPTCAQSPRALIEDAPSSLSALSIPPTMPPPGDSGDDESDDESDDEVGVKVSPIGGKKKLIMKAGAPSALQKEIKLVEQEIENLQAKRMDMSNDPQTNEDIDTRLAELTRQLIKLEELEKLQRHDQHGGRKKKKQTKRKKRSSSSKKSRKKR